MKKLHSYIFDKTQLLIEKLSRLCHEAGSRNIKTVIKAIYIYIQYKGGTLVSAVTSQQKDLGFNLTNYLFQLFQLFQSYLF